MVNAQCPYCFVTDEVPDVYAGRVTKCLSCGKSFTIKFVPTLYRESATPVVVTPKKAIHMGLPSTGKPRAFPNGEEQPIDAQSREIFAEITQHASADTEEAPKEKKEKTSRREGRLVDELNGLDTALTIVKAVVGIWIVGLLAFCVYAGIHAEYMATVAAFGVIVLLGAGLNLLRVIDQALTNVVRVLLDLKRMNSRTGRANGEAD
jgi:hypothetical protein